MSDSVKNTQAPYREPEPAVDSEQVRAALDSPRGRQLFEICVRARRRMLREAEQERSA